MSERIIARWKGERTDYEISIDEDGLISLTSDCFSPLFDRCAMTRADALAVISELQEAIGRDQATIDHEIRLLAEYLDTPDAHTGEAYIIEGSRRAVASILKLMEGE